MCSSDLVHAQARGGLQGVRQRVQQGGVAVGRFNEELGLPRFERQRLQLANALRARRRFLRQVTVEDKTLPIQPAGGQRQQQRAGAGQRLHGHAR